MNPRSSHTQKLSRRNQTLGVLNGMLVNLGNAFVDPFTVLPVFIATFGASSVLVGFVTAAFTAGWFFPQVFVAGIAQSRRRVLPIYGACAVFRFVGFVGAGASVFWIDPARGSAIMWCVIGGLALNAFAAGVAGIPFLEITSKTVPVKQRGSFFAGRRVMGGLLGILAGLLIAAVLDGDPGALWAQTAAYRWVKSFAVSIGIAGHAFPLDYGVLIIIGGVISTGGVVAYMFVHEPPAEHVAKPMPMRRLFGEGFRMLRRMPDYRTFLWMRVFYQLTAMAFPFYATFAYLRLGFSQASVGVFVSIWVGSGVLSNLVWGKLLDRSGNRVVFVSTAAMSVLPPAIMLALTLRAPETVAPGSAGFGLFALIALTFLLNGFVRAGRFIANQTYLLESAPKEHRPLYVGFMNSISFPFMLSPIFGGFVVAVLGYPALFLMGGLSAVANLATSARLVEPRRREPATSGEIVEV